MKSQSSLPFSQQPATGLSYAAPDESSPHLHILFQDPFNIIPRPGLVPTQPPI